MGPLEELKLFVSELLHGVTSEIVGAIDKTITEYEEQASRLKEENDRHRSLLNDIVRAKLPQPVAAHAGESVPAAAAISCASDLSPTHEAQELPSNPSDLQYVFTSRTDFLKFATRAADGNCPYCIKSIQATEIHLMKRHYQNSVHFIEDGTESFVVPCVCKDRIQVSGRSHWHCPICRKILFRKTNFEQHMSKQHCIAILQECPRSEMNQRAVSAFEEAPLSPELCSQQELGSLGHTEQQTVMLVQVKEEEQELWKQVSYPEWKNSEQLQIEDCQMGEQSLDADQANCSASTICMGAYPSEVISVESIKANPVSSTEPLDTQPVSGISGIVQLAGENLHTTEDKTGWKMHARSNLKALGTKRKKFVKRSLPPLSLTIKKSAGQNPTGPHCCQACGKTFHYMYTLRAHLQAHTMDKIHNHGKQLESMENTLQGNKCGVCGKQFSNNFRLKLHRRVHRPKGLNVI